MNFIPYLISFMKLHREKAVFRIAFVSNWQNRRERTESLKATIKPQAYFGFHSTAEFRD